MLQLFNYNHYMLHLANLKSENGIEWKLLLGYREIMREFLPSYLEIDNFEVEDEEACLDVFWWGFLYYEAHQGYAELIVEYLLDKVAFNEEGYIMEYDLNHNGLLDDVFKCVLNTLAEEDEFFKIDNKNIYKEYEEYAKLFFFGMYQTYIVRHNITKPIQITDFN